MAGGKIIEPLFGACTMMLPVLRPVKFDRNALDRAIEVKTVRPLGLDFAGERRQDIPRPGVILRRKQVVDIAALAVPGLRIGQRHALSLYDDRRNARLLKDPVETGDEPVEFIVAPLGLDHLYQEFLPAVDGRLAGDRDSGMGDLPGDTVPDEAQQGLPVGYFIDFIPVRRPLK